MSKENESGYNQWSKFYDSYPNPTVAIDDLFFPEFYHQLENQKVLEIGCGTGRHTRRLLDKGNQVTGVDLSEGMLAQLKTKIENGRLTLIHGDFMAGAVPLEGFDAIVMSLVLEHISDLSAFFQKAASYLKPGGELYISEIHPERTAQGTFAHFKTPSGDEVHLKSSAHTTKAVLESANACGFRQIKEQSVNGNQHLAELNSKWAKHLGRPLIQMWRFELLKQML